MKRLLAALAVAFTAVLGPAIIVDALPEPAPEFKPAPAGTTWSGTFYSCYRWGDSNEGHMRCRTLGSWHPRLYYQVVVTFRSTVTGSTTRVWGARRSVDGSSWGSWSSVTSPYGYRSSLVALSYWITY
jgi:hypothetical protein